MCDGRVDCSHGKDEFQCEFIKIEAKKYRKTEAPRNPTNDEPIVVQVGFEVQDIVDINEPEVSISCERDERRI